MFIHQWQRDKIAISDEDVLAVILLISPRYQKQSSYGVRQPRRPGAVQSRSRDAGLYQALHPLKHSRTHEPLLAIGPELLPFTIPTRQRTEYEHGMQEKFQLKGPRSRSIDVEFGITILRQQQASSPASQLSAHHSLHRPGHSIPTIDQPGHGWESDQMSMYV